MSSAPRPLHQRVIFVGVATVGGFLVLGTVLDAVGNAIALVSKPITYIGTTTIVVVAVGTQLFLSRHPIAWVVDGQPTRIGRLKALPIATMVGMVCLLWVPRALESRRLGQSSSAPPRVAPATSGSAPVVTPSVTPSPVAPSAPRATRAPSSPRLVDWPAILESNRGVYVEITNLPEHLKRSMLIPGQRYHLTFSSSPCAWHSTGPVQHPTAGLVRKHTNMASLRVTELFTATDSHTQLSVCSTPRDYRFQLMDIELTYDVNGVVYNDYPPYGRVQVGRLRKAT